MQHLSLAYNLVTKGTNEKYSILDSGDRAFQTLEAVKAVATAKPVGLGEDDVVYPHSSFFHFCSTEEDLGTDMTEIGLAKAPKDMITICDMSADFLTKPVDWWRYGVVYADVGHNVGPAGVTIVIVKNSILSGTNQRIPNALKWQTMETAAPCHAIFMCSLGFEHILTLGGVSEMEARAKARSALLTSSISSSGGFYTLPVPEKERSLTSVSFNLKTAELADQFCAEAAQVGLLDLKGNSSETNCRACLFNGMPFEGVLGLSTFMR